MLLPIYNELLDDFYKDPNHALFRHKDLGCGMLRFTKVTLEEMLWNRRDGKADLTTILVNTQNHKVYPLVDADGKYMDSLQMIYASQNYMALPIKIVQRIL